MGAKSGNINKHQAKVVPPRSETSTNPASTDNPTPQEKPARQMVSFERDTPFSRFNRVIKAVPHQRYNRETAAQKNGSLHRSMTSQPRNLQKVATLFKPIGNQPIPKKLDPSKLPKEPWKNNPNYHGPRRNDTIDVA